MFGVRKGVHRSCSHQMYHEEDGRSVWYGLRGLQGVGVDAVPESVMKVFAAWVNERKESYVGGRGHTRGAAIEVEGHDDDAEAMCYASKSKAETLIGRVTKQLETQRTGRANAEAQLNNERKRVRELELQNESIKKQLVERNTKTAEAKQHAEQLLAVMAGNCKNA